MTPSVPMLPIGIAAGTWPVNLLAGLSGLDLTTVTAVSLSVRRDVDGSTATWATTLDAGATAAELTARVAWTGAEITTPGVYYIGVTAMVASTPRSCSALKVFAIDPKRCPTPSGVIPTSTVL